MDKRLQQLRETYAIVEAMSELSNHIIIKFPESYNLSYYAIVSTPTKDTTAQIKKYDLENFQIIGAIELKGDRRFNVKRVERIHANSGFGPMLYIIAMLDNGKVAPHENSVSQEARAVWEKFSENGLTISRHIDGKHSEEYLNAKYSPSTKMKKLYKDVVAKAIQDGSKWMSQFNEEAVSLIFEEIYSLLLNSMRKVYNH